MMWCLKKNRSPRIAMLILSTGSLTVLMTTSPTPVSATPSLPTSANNFGPKINRSIVDGQVVASLQNDSVQGYASSVNNATSTWVTLPMGHLNSTLNTFWQLFHANSATSFSDRTGELAIATNGGIVLGSSQTTDQTIAINPSIDLHFATVLREGSTSLPHPVSAEPWIPEPPLDAAVDSLNQLQKSSIAVIGSGASSKVVTAQKVGGTWTGLSSLVQMQRAPSFSRCAPTVITTTALLSEVVPVVGLSCSKANVLGLYDKIGTTWQQLRIKSGSLTPGVVSVLYLENSSAGVIGIVGVHSSSGESLYSLAISDSGVALAKMGAVKQTSAISGMGTLSGQRVWLLYHSTNDLKGYVATAGSTTVSSIAPIHALSAALYADDAGSLKALLVTDGGNAISIASNSTSQGWHTLSSSTIKIPYGSSS
jgi:hypothetical protein